LEKCREMNRLPVVSLAERAMDRLLAYDWPGNVRELENIVERSLILHRSGPLSLLSLDTSQSKSLDISGPSNSSKILTLDDAMAAHIERALNASRGKVQGPGGAAEILRVNPNTLRKRMTKPGVPYGRNLSHYSTKSLD